MRALYAVAGQARMGKDTFGEMLMARTGLPRRAFGDDVKAVVVDTFGVDIAFVEKWKPLPEPPPGMHLSMRKLLQLVGDGFRTADPEVWVRRARRHATGVFCDVRYENELECIATRGGVCVLIGRTSALSADASPSEACLRPLIEWFLAHTTDALVRVADCAEAPEAARRRFRWFVRNDASVDALRALADAIVDAERGSAAAPSEPAAVSASTAAR